MWQRVEPGMQQATSKISDRDITDSYLYLLGRLVVLRQEHLDFRTGGFRWNEIIHRTVSSVAVANPNLDVAFSEAWIAPDENSYTILEIPKIEGRYYTVQIINLWGETIANINERTRPDHPSGKFALCLRGTHFNLPAGMQRIDVPGRKARVLARIELGADPVAATALQRRITLRPTGIPRIGAPITISMFTNDKLPGVEAFDTALAVLGSDRDINPGTEVLQMKVRGVVTASLGAIERKRIDNVIRQHAWGVLKRAITSLSIEHAGWVHPKVAGNYGEDWLSRTAANLTGIWANNEEEVVYFGAGSAGPAGLLDGSGTYTMTFPKHGLPEAHAKYFWSLICVDAHNLRVVPNPKNRFVLDKYSKLELDVDESLTLYFAPKLPAGAPEGNWLPTPAGQNFMLTYRAYGPDRTTTSGNWFPPPLRKK